MRSTEVDESEEIVEDDMYVEVLAQFLTVTDYLDGIKTYIAGHREERLKAREAATEKGQTDAAHEGESPGECDLEPSLTFEQASHDIDQSRELEPYPE